MKIKLFKKEFPLVALVLLAIGLGSGVLAFNYSSQAVTIINSDEALRFSGDFEPESLYPGEYPSIDAPSSFAYDYYFRAIPAPTPLENITEREPRIKEIPEDSVQFKKGKLLNTYNVIKAGDNYYRYDFDLTDKEMNGGVDYREIKKGRTPWLLSYYGPKVLASLAVAIVAISLAFALLNSYKNGYITNRNIVLVKLSAGAIGAALLSFFVAKGLLIIGVFGSYGFYDEIWSDLIIGSILPTLLILAAIIGLTHIVAQNMRNLIAMKEEIDGTV